MMQDDYCIIVLTGSGFAIMVVNVVVGFILLVLVQDMLAGHSRDDRQVSWWSPGNRRLLKHSYRRLLQHRNRGPLQHMNRRQLQLRLSRLLQHRGRRQLQHRDSRSLHGNYASFWRLHGTL